MPSPDKVAKTQTAREPFRVVLDQPAPIVHMHVTEPRPLMCSDRNCAASAGLTLRAWRKVARSMSSAGMRVTTTADGLTALLSDVERWLAEHAPSLPVETETEVGEPATDGELSDREIARRAGVKLRVAR